jgi:hypothetical protein
MFAKRREHHLRLAKRAIGGVHRVPPLDDLTRPHFSLLPYGLQYRFIPVIYPVIILGYSEVSVKGLFQTHPD